jgi:lysophospholipase L1-like esterase
MMNRRNFLYQASSTLFLSLPFDIWAHTQPVVDDISKLKTLLAAKDPMIWLFTGDSITHGVKHTHGERSYPEIAQERIRYEIKRYRDVVINTGISGHTTQLVLDDFQWRVAHFKPSVVSFMLGTNDCALEKVNPEQFHSNLKQLITSIRALGAIPIMHTPNTIIASKAKERITIGKYTTLIRQVAQEQRVILVDNYTHWLQADETEVHRSWLNDALHPNGTGHKQIAHTFFKAIDIFDPEAPTCGAPYYEGEH